MFWVPDPSQLGASRTGGIDLNNARSRHALAEVLALAASPTGFSEFTDKVLAITGWTKHDYTVRQGAYDLRKLRAKQLVAKPGRSRRFHHLPPAGAPTIPGILAVRDHLIAPILAVRDHVIAPILAGVCVAPAEPQANHLDHSRPRLRTTPHRHKPLKGPRHQHTDRRIANKLSIALCKRLINDHALADVMVDQGRVNVERFSWEATVDQLIRLYERAIAGQDASQLSPAEG